MTQQRHVHVGQVTFGNDKPLSLIAGPCQLESRAHAHEMCHALTELTGGLGMDKSLPIMAELRETFGCPVLTDIHSIEQCAPVAEAVDILQIPAFLCRQTDLLLAAGETGKTINVKKGQFLAPWDMKNVADKVASTGNQNLL